MSSRTTVPPPWGIAISWCGGTLSDPSLHLQSPGWQVYGTNALALTLSPVVWAYRGQYRIEDDWSRLKGRSLSLTPVYLQDEERIQGWVSLLSLALRVLTLVEWVVRERLRQERARL